MSGLWLERYIAIMSDGLPVHEEMYRTEAEAREAALRVVDFSSRTRIECFRRSLHRIVRIRVPVDVEARVTP